MRWKGMRKGKSLAFGIGRLPPCGRGGFFFKFSFGRLRGGRRGGLSGAAAPPRPPLHSPRNTPLGFPYSANSQAPSILTPGNPVGLSNLRQPARAARLLLRELPSLQSGDFPARRAMPSTNWALIGCCPDRRPPGVFDARLSAAIRRSLRNTIVCFRLA